MYDAPPPNTSEPTKNTFPRNRTYRKWDAKRAENYSEKDIADSKAERQNEYPTFKAMFLVER